MFSAIPTIDMPASPGLLQTVDVVSTLSISISQMSILESTNSAIPATQAIATPGSDANLCLSPAVERAANETIWDAAHAFYYETRPRTMSPPLSGEQIPTPPWVVRHIPSTVDESIDAVTKAFKTKLILQTKPSKVRYLPPAHPAESPTDEDMEIDQVYTLEFIEGSEIDS
jgi:hypothetical protein